MPTDVSDVWSKFMYFQRIWKVFPNLKESLLHNITCFDCDKIAKKFEFVTEIWQNFS